MACPGAVSPTKVYSGCPSKVAWTEPSDRVIVPNVPVTPDAVAGPFTGGQFCAHVPLQLDLVGVSGANEYSVNPLALVSTVAPPIVAVFRLPAVAAAGLLVLVRAAAGGGCAGRTARRQYRHGCGDGQHRQQHPETAWPAGDPLRAIAVA